MFYSIVWALSVSLSGLSYRPITNRMNTENLRRDITACRSIADEEGIEQPEDKITVINDFAGNEFYVMEGKEDGFVIYDPVSGNYIEKTAEMSIPFEFDSASELYYLGPTNYFRKVESNLYHSIITDEYVNEEYMIGLQKAFSSRLDEFRAQSLHMAEPSSDLILPGKKHYIANYELIKNAKRPGNYDGSCGFVAASLVLNYWHNTMYNQTILPQFLDEQGNMNDTESEFRPDINLKDKLVEFNGGKTASWAYDVKNSLVEYAKWAGLSCNVGYYLLGTGAKLQLAQGNPVILFGLFPDYPESNLIAHAVTAYGYDSLGYIVDYGWGPESSEVTISHLFVGSNTTFRLQNYEESVTITPQDYGFPGSYNATEQTASHSVGGLNFTTSRLRTGYIENEYITMSPRRAGYGTAYIEYDFERVVEGINVDLTYWSDDERYYSWDGPTAVIEYQSLTDNTWIQKENILNLGLPTNRSQPKTYRLDFPERTRKIRFYTHFKAMSGFTDRNKGRICIGDMTVDTFF